MGITKEPGEIDKIPYDAPLSFTEPSPKWKREMGMGSSNNHPEFIPDEQMPKVDLTGKWVVISGSNSGIGREAALAFARMGANLILACRQPPPTEQDPESVAEECRVEAAKAKYSSTIEFWEFDASDFASVESFAQRWLQTERALDILCNNAGIGSSPGGFDVFKTKDGFEIIHQVYHYVEEYRLQLLTITEGELFVSCPPHASTSPVAGQSRNSPNCLHYVLLSLPWNIRHFQFQRWSWPLWPGGCPILPKQQVIFSNLAH